MTLSGDVKQFVVVFPDGHEHFCEVEKGSFSDNAIGICGDAVRKSSLTTPRRNPVAIKVDLYRLLIKDGALKRQLACTHEIVPTLTTMTSAEMDEELDKALEEIPEAFHSYIRKESWDRGHSCGREEVVNIATEMISDLAPCIRAYDKKC